MMKVLLVEDNADASAAIAQLLTGAVLDVVIPFECFYAYTLAEALEQVALHNPEVVLLDLFLPDSKGSSTVKTLRERYPDLPIVVMTGAAGIEEQVIECGSDACLSKMDLSIRTLVEIIELVVKMRGSNTALNKAVSDVRDTINKLDANARKMEGGGR